MIIGNRFTKAVLVALAMIGLLGLLFPASASAETLSQLLQRQADLQRQAAENRQKLNQKKQEVSDLQGVISGIDSDIADTEANISNSEDQISVTEGVISELDANIQQTQSQLDDLQGRLRSAYIGLYELSQTSTVDSILSSASLSDIVSQTQYIQALQSDLQVNIKKANDLKSDLETKKTDNEAQKANLVNLRQDLVISRNFLNSRRAQKNYLLSQTQGQQAQYEALLKKLQSQQEVLSQAIYDARRAGGGGEQFIGGTGDYPWAFEPDAYAVDPWLFYKRQCTSFAAWKFQSFYGLVFYNTRPGQGSAWNWPALAHDQGYQTSSTPRADAIVSFPVGTNMPYGHVAWVDRVNANGTIDVEEYNWTINRGYSQRLGVDPHRYGTATYIFP